MGTNGGTVGGGEILQHLPQGQQNQTSTMLNQQTITEFNVLPYVRVAIIIALIALMVIMILRLFKIRSVFGNKGVNSELKQVDKLKKRDKRILQANKFISTITNFIQRTPLSIANSNVEYWQYNLTRANVKIPGGSRFIRAQEFNAIVKLITLCVVAVGLILMLTANLILGAVIMIISVILAHSLPMMILRQIVAAKDNEIDSNFTDLYLMIHYVLIADADTTLSSVMRSYSKTTTSKEMQRFINVCIDYIDTYGEYEGTKYISRDYREIPVVCKLMRLIRQANEGGNVKEELKGFREELIREKKYTISRRMGKLVKRANWSFNILMIVLVQAIVSAMAIYLQDLGSLGSFLG